MGRRKRYKKYLSGCLAEGIRHFKNAVFKVILIVRNRKIVTLFDSTSLVI